MDTRGFLSDEVRLEQHLRWGKFWFNFPEFLKNLWASESLVADGDDVSIGELVAVLNVQTDGIDQ